MWRRLFAGDALTTSGERLGALLLFISALIFLSAEVLAVYSVVRTTGIRQAFGSLDNLELPELPRVFAFFAALLFGAASSLQNPQNRTIASRTFWTIPTAVSAIALSACGWLAIHAYGPRAIILGPIENLPVHRLLAYTPVILFGFVMLGIRPQLQIRNSLSMGRELTHWWQFLGLMCGLSVVVSLDSSATVTEVDLVHIAMLMAGQILSLRTSRPLITFAPTLASVPLSETEKNQVLTSIQN